MAKGRNNAKQTDPAQGDQAATGGGFSGKQSALGNARLEHPLPLEEANGAQAAVHVDPDLARVSGEGSPDAVIDPAVLAGFRAQRAVARALFVAEDEPDDEVDADWEPPMLTYGDCEVMAAAARGDGADPALLAAALQLTGRPLPLTRDEWQLLAGVMGTVLLQVDAWLAAKARAAEPAPQQRRVSPDELSDLALSTDEPFAGASYAHDLKRNYLINYR